MTALHHSHAARGRGRGLRVYVMCVLCVTVRRVSCWLTSFGSSRLKRTLLVTRSTFSWHTPTANDRSCSENRMCLKRSAHYVKTWRGWRSGVKVTQGHHAVKRIRVSKGHCLHTRQSSAGSWCMVTQMWLDDKCCHNQWMEMPSVSRWAVCCMWIMQFWDN